MAELGLNFVAPYFQVSGFPMMPQSCLLSLSRPIMQGLHKIRTNAVTICSPHQGEGRAPVCGVSFRKPSLTYCGRADHFLLCTMLSYTRGTGRLCLRYVGVSTPQCLSTHWCESGCLGSNSGVATCLRDGLHQLFFPHRHRGQTLNLS